MKKLFQNPIVAVGVLILAVVVGVIIGQIRKPASLPEVSYGTWICDSAKMLSASAEAELSDYNSNWNTKYGGIVAVATVKSIKGWEADDFADTLGKRWGLGEKDMLLLIYPKGNGVEYRVAQGTYLQEYQMDSQMYSLKTAIENVIYTQGAEAGAVALFRQTDVYYAQVLGQFNDQPESDSTRWRDRSGVKIFGVILLIGAIFLVWAILDRVRYSRYQRRVAVNPVPAVSYYPIFWGRPARAAAAAPTPPHQTGMYHSPNRPSNTSGSYSARKPIVQRPPIQKPGVQRPGSQKPFIQKPGMRPTDTATGTPAKPVVTKPHNSGKNGFGGGKR